jgi:two-component system, NtrC family, sensor kinase
MLRSRSLGARMVVLFSGLLAAIGVFMVAFFPARMELAARASTEQRVHAIAQVMATAIGPAVEFDDPDNATQILRWMATTPDAEFAVVQRADGTELAAWQANRIPVRLALGSEPSVSFRDDVLVVSAPVRGIGGGRGMLHLGFSLAALEEERNDSEQMVAMVSMLVVLAGVFATLLVAAFVVRPIRKLTSTARRISRGELPPKLPALPGTDEVAELAEALRAMLERVNEVSNQELVRASRHAGMAEVATGVLHNVGNVLNSVNVSVELMRERLDGMPLPRLRQLHALLEAAAASGSLDGERAAAATRFVALVADALERGREQSLKDIDGLRANVDHIKRVVAMQNAYARHGGVVENTRIGAIVDEALEMALPASRRGDIALGVEVDGQQVGIDRHRVLQIVVNLVANARDAVQSAAEGSRRAIGIAATVIGGRVRIEVTDSGVGIAPEALERIFSAGFTTKPRGHGYGLHSAALAARQLGGELLVASEGLGRGATFTLAIPVGGPAKGSDEA